MDFSNYLFRLCLVKGEKRETGKKCVDFIESYTFYTILIKKKIFFLFSIFIL